MMKTMSYSLTNMLNICKIQFRCIAMHCFHAAYRCIKWVYAYLQTNTWSSLLDVQNAKLIYITVERKKHLLFLEIYFILQNFSINSIQTLFVAKFQLISNLSKSSKEIDEIDQKKMIKCKSILKLADYGRL